MVDTFEHRDGSVPTAIRHRSPTSRSAAEATPGDAGRRARCSPRFSCHHQLARAAETAWDSADGP